MKTIFEIPPVSTEILCHVQWLITGFPLYFGIEIQGLFKDFQGP